MRLTKRDVFVGGVCLLMCSLGALGILRGFRYRALTGLIQQTPAAHEVRPSPQSLVPNREIEATADNSIPEAQPAPLTPELKRYHHYTNLRFRPLLNSLHLDPRRRARIEQVLADHAEMIYRLGVQWSGDARWRGRKNLTDELEGAVRTILTDSEMGAFKNDLTLEELTKAVSKIGAELYVQGTPMTALQIEQLTRALAGSRSTNDQAAPVLELSQTDWDKALKTAATFLRPEQLAPLKELAARITFNQDFKEVAGYSLSQRIPGL